MSERVFGTISGGFREVSRGEIKESKRTHRGKLPGKKRQLLGFLIWIVYLATGVYMCSCLRRPAPTANLSTSAASFMSEIQRPAKGVGPHESKSG